MRYMKVAEAANPGMFPTQSPCSVRPEESMEQPNSLGLDIPSNKAWRCQSPAHLRTGASIPGSRVFRPWLN